MPEATLSDMRPVPLPTVALTPSRIPASHKDSADPFFHFDGYAESREQERMTDIRHRAVDEGLDALTVQELRIELFRTRRAQRHGGGPYGENDLYDRHMAVVLDEIRARVDARGGGIGLWRGDITTLVVDVTVNAANPTLAGGGGVDRAIHRAAGPGLLDACLEIEEVRPAVRCPPGDARITPAFDLPSTHVVHAVGPVWRGGDNGEPEALAFAYRASLDLASGVGAESIAFPALSTGAYGYPLFDAATVAATTCQNWLRDSGSDLRILFVAFDMKSEKALRAALNRFVRP